MVPRGSSADAQCLRTPAKNLKKRRKREAPDIPSAAGIIVAKPAAAAMPTTTSPEM
jgi:hypothetical protein